MSFTIESLEKDGFVGFVSVRELHSSRDQIPNSCGVYVVFRSADSPPAILERSPAGWFKNQDPSRPIALLGRKWVPGATLIYVGKAGPTRTRTLRRRISELLDFASGLPKAHRGGSALWQLADSEELLVAWKATDGLDPRDLKKLMLTDFRSHFGSLPYANFQS